MTTLVSPASTPTTGLKVKLRLSNPKSPSISSSVPQTDSSPEVLEQAGEEHKDNLDSTFDSTPTKKPRYNDSEPNHVEVPFSETITNTPNDTKREGVEMPRKWQKRSLVIRTLTGEVSFTSWRPDGPPLLKRPATIEKFNSPHPIADSTRPVPCVYPGCNRNFTDQSGLTKHMIVHGPKTFFCGLDGCAKSFADRTRLRRHQRGVHGQ
ncbi:Transcriptional repressor protein yy1 [Basidiobolus ranarum]|uniref:Transcriptional repressor protein yy1 n=1 Tax=Basidiobolus ranarum TaxID=34480 RepID=A0ABR2VMX5_9FUNG